MRTQIFQIIALLTELCNLVLAVPTPQPRPLQSLNTRDTNSEASNAGTSLVFPPEKPEPVNLEDLQSVNTDLDTTGHNLIPENPFPDSADTAETLPEVDPEEFSELVPEADSFAAPPNYGCQASPDLLTPLSTEQPPNLFARRGDHPVPRQGLQNDRPLQTNKFYSNFFLGDRRLATWTNPYSIWWQNDGNFGLAVSHTEANQKIFGPDPSQNPPRYYINPLNINSVTMGASEFNANMGLSITEATHLKANVILHPDKNNQGSPNRITFPIHQGMGFITGLYNNLTPKFSSGVLYRNTRRVTDNQRAGITKYRIQLEDGKIWLLYAVRTDGESFTQNRGGDPLMLEARSYRELVATGPFTGIIQLAKLPDGGSAAEIEKIYDNAAGSYVNGKELHASVDGNVASYGFTFTKGGVPANTPLLNFALPHHVDSLVEGQVTKLKMDSTTKGVMTAVLGDKWTMREHDLPTSFGMWPLNENKQTARYSQAQLAKIKAAVMNEVDEDMQGASDLDSMYFSGKALSKYAQICWTAHQVVGDRDLAISCLNKLRPNFFRFSENRQKHPLVYDTAWKGLISSISFNYPGLDLNHDFGNPGYNDHHFHYSYHVHAAALITFLDRQLGLGDSFFNTIRPFVTTLIRDFSNPSAADPHFPVFRAFDWFHGHSWAKGLFASGDGKDQESSSEDAFSSYALKLWAQQVSNPSLEALANLMLSIQRRSFSSYFLLDSSNTNHPQRFIDNKVTGILFENKVDHTTYFGAEKEKIHGIHMIPLTPISTYIRSKKFVSEEWERHFRNHVDSVNDGWRGIVMANRAITDPSEGWKFFAGESKGWNNGWIDGGASRSWYLTFAAGLGGQ